MALTNPLAELTMLLMLLDTNCFGSYMHPTRHAIAARPAVLMLGVGDC